VRIALDVRRIRDFGIGTYIRNLLRAFGQLEADHEFLLIGPSSEQEYFRDLPANFVRVPYATSDLDRSDHIRLPMLVRRLNVDLTHIPLNRVQLFLPSPYVVTVHDLSNFIFDQSSPWLHELRRYRFVRGVSRSDRVIAVSSATQRDLINIAGIRAKRIEVIYNAPDPAFLHSNGSAAGSPNHHETQHAERRRILERYQIDYPFLLYVGHIRPQKNIPRLVKAFAFTCQQLADHPEYNRLRLILIGDEIHRHPEVRRAIIQSRVEDRVRFLGFVPLETLRVIYELAAVFLFTSLYEGFGLPPREAMACGTPVVTSNVSSLPEVVDDAAMIVNPENVFDIARGIQEVLCDQDLREMLVARGRLRASSFSWLKAAEATLKVYEKVLLQSGRKRRI
jgi:glycosyltransferase involved in cell wall biosynthesis